MRIFVTGVGGQLGHDCVDEALERGYEVCGSDIQPTYSGAQDGSPVTKCSYVQLDVTDEKAVKETIECLKPDVIIHCAAWTAVNAAEDEENKEKLSKAARPFNSRLDKSKLVEAGFKPLPDWKDAVRRYLAEAEL